MGRVLPILFNTDMVHAILEDRKTVTRRCIKPRRKNACGFYVTFRKSDNAFMGVYDYDENERQFDNPQSPPCQPGNILYVRETWAQIKDIADWKKFYRSNGHPITQDEYIYKADNVCVNGILPEIKWHPSIHMPKEVARIWLKVTDVRAERLQEVTKEEIKNEGIYDDGTYPTDKKVKIRPDIAHLCGVWTDEAYKERFAMIWDSTIKKSDLALYGWLANPYVWVIEFERCEKPEGEN